MPRRRYPRLWHEPGDKDDADSEPNHPKSASVGGTHESFLRARSAAFTDLVELEVPPPIIHPVVVIISNSFVVGQELALSTLLLARHRDLVAEDGGVGGTAPEEVDDEEKWTQLLSVVLVSLTLMLIIFYSELQTAPSDAVAVTAPRVRKRDRMLTRTTDAILLAGILRLLSAVLRTLTASYSSDTVYALAIGGMVVHLLACDYSYANGVTKPSTCVQRSGPEMGYQRPAFLGGTVSLNAALFSTTLLASRLPSNATGYAFISSSVILFAFYPAARHAIAKKSKGAVVSPCLLITIALSFAALLLLETREKALFSVMQACMCLISPTLKWYLQRYKKIISGPWDIAHIFVDETVAADHTEAPMLRKKESGREEGPSVKVKEA